MTPAPISVRQPNGTATAAQPPRLRPVVLPSGRPRANATLCTVDPAWSSAPDGTISRLFPAGKGHAWLATWDGELDLRPLTGAPDDSSPQIHHVFPEQLPAAAPSWLRRLGTVMHVWTPALWEALSTAIMMTHAPSPDAARTLVRRWSQAFGERHLTDTGRVTGLALVPGPETVLALPDKHFRTYGAPYWRGPLRTAADAYTRHADSWHRLDNEGLARAFTGLGIGRTTADTAVAHCRADFARYPLRSDLSVPGATDDQRHALALFALAALNGAPSFTAPRVAPHALERQSPGRHLQRAAPGTPLLKVRADAPGHACPGALQRNLMVVVLNAGDTAETSPARPAPHRTEADTDERRSAPRHDGPPPPERTLAVDFGRLPLDDGTVAQLRGLPPGAERSPGTRDALLSEADLALLLLQTDRPEEAAPLLALVARHDVPYAVAVAVARQPTGASPDTDDIRKRLGLGDLTPVLLTGHRRDPGAARRLLTQAVKELHRSGAPACTSPEAGTPQ
ncbi:hypothetical protein ACFWGI_39485 [Streptomyces niveus]|uniref:hypothetical protein n=1 Tax=Streptomyces niveus TaxID=193462 RepID=UPI003669C7F1